MKQFFRGFLAINRKWVYGGVVLLALASGVGLSMWVYQQFFYQNPLEQYNLSRFYPENTSAYLEIQTKKPSLRRHLRSFLSHCLKGVPEQDSLLRPIRAKSPFFHSAIAMGVIQTPVSAKSKTAPSYGFLIAFPLKAIADPNKLSEWLSVSPSFWQAHWAVAGNTLLWSDTPTLLQAALKLDKTLSSPQKPLSLKKTAPVYSVLEHLDRHDDGFWVFQGLQTANLYQMLERMAVEHLPGSMKQALFPTLSHAGERLSGLFPVVAGTLSENTVAVLPGKHRQILRIHGMAPIALQPSNPLLKVLFPLAVTGVVLGHEKPFTLDALVPKDARYYLAFQDLSDWLQKALLFANRNAVKASPEQVVRKPLFTSLQKILSVLGLDLEKDVVGLFSGESLLYVPTTGLLPTLLTEETPTKGQSAEKLSRAMALGLLPVRVKPDTFCGRPMNVYTLGTRPEKVAVVSLAAPPVLAIGDLSGLVKSLPCKQESLPHALLQKINRESALSQRPITGSPLYHALKAHLPRQAWLQGMAPPSAVSEKILFSVGSAPMPGVQVWAVAVLPEAPRSK